MLFSSKILTALKGLSMDDRHHQRIEMNLEFKKFKVLF